MDGTGPRANSSTMRLPEEELIMVMIDNVAPDGAATELLRDEVFRVVHETA
jgi:hypothetical protein